MTCSNPMPQCTESNNFFMDLSPPPPPPRRMNCGELREHHNGIIVEIHGRVNRTRMGRFIELKDQYGVIQLVAPMEVNAFYQLGFELYQTIKSIDQFN